MIVDRDSGVTVEGNLTGQVYKAGIDDENMAHVIGLFTDLYSDREMAVIREYSTNAYDAQIEAGVSRPIEVTLPTPLSPFFKVKDYGVGLSADDIRTIYSRYGTSTKRSSNDQVGMLGLGCKAALTYTEQFMVESVKDGLRTVCSISRDGQSVPVFTVVASVPDDGPSGTEVIVPVRSGHYDVFEEKAATFFSYWEPGTVLVNGKQPEPLDGLKISDDIMICRDESSSWYMTEKHKIVMGNVAYPVERYEFDLDLPSRCYVVARVPIGAVNFVPSREALDYNRTTRATLLSLPKQVHNAIEEAVQREVDNASSPREALRVLFRWNDLLPDKDDFSYFSYKGDAIPERVGRALILTDRKSSKLSAYTKAPGGIESKFAPSALFVVGYSAKSFTAAHKRKLLKYAEDNGIDCEFFALTPDPELDSEWVSYDQIVQWEDVRAVKLPRVSASRSQRPASAYEAYVKGDFKHIQAEVKYLQAEDIDMSKPLYYLRSRSKEEAYCYSALICKYEPEATVIRLPENRYVKFMRNFPDAKPCYKAVKDLYESWYRNLSDEEKEAILLLDFSDWDKLEYLDPERIDDPTLRRAVTIARRVDVESLINALHEFGYFLNTKQSKPDGWVDPLSPYVLLYSLRMDFAHGSDDEDHLYLYLNAAYKA